MRAQSIPKYIRGLARGLKKFRPRDVLNILGGTPFVVKQLGWQGFSIVVDVRDPAISRPILLIGEYERNVTELVVSLVRDNTRFLDIGANIGYFSLLAASRHEGVRVTSFEPDPDNVRLFKTSVALNGFESRINVYPCAVSDRNETLQFSNLGYERNRGARFTAKSRDILEARAIENGARFSQVQAVCLDELLGNENFDLVKVDIEGYEPHAFKGMENLLRRNRPVVITEFAPGTIEHITRTDPADLLKLFVRLGYLLNIIDENGELMEFGDGTGRLMDHYRQAQTHHIDLLLKPAFSE